MSVNQREAKEVFGLKDKDLRSLQFVKAGNQKLFKVMNSKPLCLHVCLDSSASVSVLSCACDHPPAPGKRGSGGRCDAS